MRSPRPFQTKYAPDTHLITGMRILDFLFPLAKGGAAGIPGPFGSGKTVTQQSLRSTRRTNRGLHRLR